jgi:hypothetical protein
MNRFVPGRYVNLNLLAGEYCQLFNAHCYHVGGFIEFTWTGPMRYDSTLYGLTAPDSIGTSRLVWRVPDFYTFDMLHALRLIFTIDTSATFGSYITTDASIRPISGDVNPDNNTLPECVSHKIIFLDPNYKRSAVQPPELIQPPIGYTIPSTFRIPAPIPPIIYT